MSDANQDVEKGFFVPFTKEQYNRLKPMLDLAGITKVYPVDVAKTPVIFTFEQNEIDKLQIMQLLDRAESIQAVIQNALERNYLFLTQNSKD